MPYLRQRSLTGIPASASFKIATIWLSVMRLLIVKLLCFSLKEILRVGCIILRGSYKSMLNKIICLAVFGIVSKYMFGSQKWIWQNNSICIDSTFRCNIFIMRWKKIASKYSFYIPMHILNMNMSYFPNTFPEFINNT